MSLLSGVRVGRVKVIAFALADDPAYEPIAHGVLLVVAAALTTDRSMEPVAGTR